MRRRAPSGATTSRESVNPHAPGFIARPAGNRCCPAVSWPPHAGDCVEGLADLERVAVAQVQQDGLRLVRHQLADPLRHRWRADTAHSTAAHAPGECRAAAADPATRRTRSYASIRGKGWGMHGIRGLLAAAAAVIAVAACSTSSGTDVKHGSAPAV